MEAYEIQSWWGETRPCIAERLWDTWQAEHRKTLPLAVQVIRATSVYEIGCGAGPNLRLLRAEHPTLPLGGSDINRPEVDWVNDHLGIGATVQTIPHQVDPRWDTVLSCFVLAYCLPSRVSQMLRQLTSRVLILMEPHGDDEYCFGSYDDVSPRWSHDWQSMARATGWHLAYRWPIYPADGLDSLRILTR